MIFPQEMRDIYYAVYETEIKTKPKIQFTSTKPATKGDSILKEFSELFMKNLEQAGFIIKIIDSLTIRNDTSFISSTAANNKSEDQQITLNINIENNVRILTNNIFMSKRDSSQSYTPVPGENEKFIFSGTGVSILGYDTKVFINESETIKIWVSKSLPAGLNPKIQISNPVGGILKYEIKSPDQTTTTIIKSLKKS